MARTNAKPLWLRQNVSANVWSLFTLGRGERCELERVQEEYREKIESLLTVDPSVKCSEFA